jgi:hypothetical protein
MRSYSQINARGKYFLVPSNTVWLYPMADITTALDNTSYPYTFDGTIIVCPDIASLIGIYTDIYNQTTISQPVGNVGYTIGIGSLLEDLGNSIWFKLSNGKSIVEWRLVRQITPQLPATVIPVPGNSPPGTIGYSTVFTSYGNGLNGGYSVGLDDCEMVRIG